MPGTTASPRPSSLRRLCAVGLTLATALLVAPAAPDAGLAPAAAAEPAATPVAARTMDRPADDPGHRLPGGQLQRPRRRPHRSRRQPEGLGVGHRAHGPRRQPAGAEHPRRRRLPGVPAAAGGPLRGADGHVVADLPGPQQPGRPVGQLDRVAHRRVDAPRGAHPPDPLLRRRAEPDAGRAPAERRHRPPRLVLQHPQPGRRPRSGAGLPRRRLRDGGRPRQRAAGGLPRRVRSSRWATRTSAAATTARSPPAPTCGRRAAATSTAARARRPAAARSTGSWAPRTSSSTATRACGTTSSPRPATTRSTPPTSSSRPPRRSASTTSWWSPSPA